MRGQKAPRYQGRITTWKDDQGFGFITPNGGGPAVFVHISGFTQRGARPASNDIVSYHLSINDKGPRAEQVALVRARVSQRSASSSQTGPLIAAAGLFGFVGLCVATGKLPPAFFGVYLLASVLAFLVYASDKSAARKGMRRTPERTLHLIGLLGGWPGALLAQQLLRHKSKKTSFRTVFWATVILNCVTLVGLGTPLGGRVLRDLLGTL